MQCMKCGREIPVDQVFCQECLEDMEKYPVDPGVVVTLPPAARAVRQMPAAKSHRHKRTLEEQAKLQRKWLRVTSWLLVLTVSLLIGAGGLIYSLLNQEDEPLPGQNYSEEGEINDPNHWYSDPLEDLADKAETEESTEGRQNLNGQ